MHVVIAAAAVTGGLTTFYTLFAGLAAVLTVLGAVWVSVKLYHKFLKRTSDFLDDWSGEKARPGVDARPGVMARLASQDAMLTEHTAVLEAIQHEVNYNSGSTIKDAVHRIDSTLKSVVGQLTDARSQATTNASEAAIAVDNAAGHAQANENRAEQFRQDQA